MQTALEIRLLKIADNTKGNFASPARFAEQVDLPEWQVRQVLDKLLIMLMIDKFDLMADGRTTSFYGLHNGVRPGQAMLDRMASGKVFNQ